MWHAHQRRLVRKLLITGHKQSSAPHSVGSTQHMVVQGGQQVQYLLMCWYKHSQNVLITALPACYRLQCAAARRQSAGRVSSTTDMRCIAKAFLLPGHTYKHGLHGLQAACPHLSACRCCCWATTPSPAGRTCRRWARFRRSRMCASAGTLCCAAPRAAGATRCSTLDLF